MFGDTCKSEQQRRVESEDWSPVPATPVITCQALFLVVGSSNSGQTNDEPPVEGTLL